jgi:choline dehydrogenase-like flavoprotein
MPAAFPHLFKTKYDWDFASEPEPGLGERRVYLPRGITLGGSSAINAMIYIRGNAADFDGWADEEGAPVTGRTKGYFVKGSHPRGRRLWLDPNPHAVRYRTGR